MTKTKTSILLAITMLCGVASAQTKITSPSQIQSGGNYDFAGTTLTQQVIITQSNVTVSNLHITGVHNQAQNENAALILEGSNITLNNPTVDHCDGTGIGNVGDTNSTINNPQISYCGQNGMGGSACKNVTVNGGEIQFCNYGMTTEPVWYTGQFGAVAGGKPWTDGKYYSGPGNEGGGGKWANTTGVVINATKYHDCTGPGVWFDITNSGFLVENVQSYSNKGLDATWEGTGIQTELSLSGKITGCYTYNNAGSDYACFESQNVTITGNWGKNVEFRAMTGRGVTLGNDTITNNHLLQAPSAPSGTPGMTISGNIVGAFTPPVAGLPTPTTNPTPTAPSTVYTDAKGNIFSVANGQITVNGTLDTNTNGVAAGQIINGVFYQTASSGFWSASVSGTTVTWTKVAALPTTLPASPTPPTTAVQPTVTEVDVKMSDGSMVVTRP